MLSSYVVMSDHDERADEEPAQGQSAVSLTPSVSSTGEGDPRKAGWPAEIYYSK